ncbi:MAG: DHH family phosphoesterase [Sandaracinus sp.]|nr:DHH family phosphoesterase [Sandaracinus sp.]MCB9614300.1 DHH family phosphoesterase [Sandaracinus sp.]
MSRADTLRIVREGSRFLVTCHRRPDADALGSAIGLAEILRSLGKEAHVWVPESLAPNLMFFAVGRVERELPEGEFDATFVMDTAARALLPRGIPNRGAGPLVVVDHHAAHDDVGDVVCRECDACSTAEVVMRLAAELGARPVPEAAAAPLYAALVADTGGFRYAMTTPETLRLGAELLERGADAWQTAYELFEGWPPARLRLLGEVLETLELSEDGRVALLRVTRDMLARTGADDDMVEGMVNYGRMLRGVEIAALLWEFPSEKGGLDTKLSLRSSGAANVAKLATALGGGGHRAAAGAQIEEDVEATRKRVLHEASVILAEM